MHKRGSEAITNETIESITVQLQTLQNLAQLLENSRNNELHGSNSGFQIDKKIDVAFYADVRVKINDIRAAFESWARSPSNNFEALQAMQDCFNFLHETNCQMWKREYQNQ